MTAVCVVPAFCAILIDTKWTISVSAALAVRPAMLWIVDLDTLFATLGNAERVVGPGTGSTATVAATLPLQTETSEFLRATEPGCTAIVAC
jgi:hypothetical protein